MRARVLMLAENINSFYAVLKIIECGIHSNVFFYNIYNFFYQYSSKQVQNENLLEWWSNWKTWHL